MADLEERMTALYERLGIEYPRSILCRDRLRAGFRTYGRTNHLDLSAEDFERELVEEVADVLNFIAALDWSRAYHSALADHDASPLDAQDAADDALDTDLIDAALLLWDLVDRRYSRGEPSCRHPKTVDPF